MLIDKYEIGFDDKIIINNARRLTNQLWKLIPMRENNEDWQKQLSGVIVEISGLNEIFMGPSYLQILSKLEGLAVQDLTFEMYRKIVFECINLLQELIHELGK